MVSPGTWVFNHFRNAENTFPMASLLLFLSVMVLNCFSHLFSTLHFSKLTSLMGKVLQHQSAVGLLSLFMFGPVQPCVSLSRVCFGICAICMMVGHTIDFREQEVIDLSQYFPFPQTFLCWIRGFLGSFWDCNDLK